MLESWKLAPAIATGNSVVLKVGRVHPALRLPVAGHLRGGLPPKGVFNMVHGFGEEGFAA